MDYQFEKFKGRNVRLEDRITVTKSNSIGFPTFFYKKNRIGRYKYVVLFFDKGKMAVGVHFTNDEEEKNKFSIIRSKRGYGGLVVARSFFKTYGINPVLYYGRYKWKKYKSEKTDELFVITLKKKEKDEEAKQEADATQKSTNG